MDYRYDEKPVFRFNSLISDSHMQAKPTLWLRAEHKPKEARTAVTPTAAKALIAAGYNVVFEASNQRAFADSLYVDAGCTLAEEHSWQQAPDDAIIIGLKELSASLGPFRHRHIHFAHVYKGQSGWQTFLNQFNNGAGTLYDLEYLVDEDGRRIAAFGYWAGYVGAAIALLQWSAQQNQHLLGSLMPWNSREQLLADVQTAIKACGLSPAVMVIGAKGRSGGGAVELCQACGLKVTQWDQNETKNGGPFDEMLQHHLMINCVFLSKPVPPFTTMPHLQKPGRLLSVISDVSCDPFSDANPLPIYNDCTSMDEPSMRIIESSADQLQPLDLISIDHLPSLLPVESSEEFANALMPYLLSIDQIDTGVWQRAADVFNRKSAEAQSEVGD